MTTAIRDRTEYRDKYYKLADIIETVFEIERRRQGNIKIAILSGLRVRDLPYKILTNGTITLLGVFKIVTFRSKFEFEHEWHDS